MEFTRSGVPLSFEVTFDSPALDVAMTVWDDSGVSPVLLATLPMINFDGNSYRAKYTPAAGKTYLVNKSVYTDGTYLTRDSSYSQSSESFRSEDIAGLIWNALTLNYLTPGTFGGSAGSSGGGGNGSSEIIGIVDDSEPIIGIVYQGE